MFDSFKEQGQHLLHIPVEDETEADLESKFETACAFLGKAIVMISEECIPNHT